jgi:hypothetical protein
LVAIRALRRLPRWITYVLSRSLPRFGELRKHVYAQIQMAKQGWRPPASARLEAEPWWQSSDTFYVS